MVTGASTADAAIILVDARHGLTAQSKRHAYIAWLLGIRHLLIAVNKMDLVDFDLDVFGRVREALDTLAGRLPGAHFHVVPVSALDGDNVVRRSERTPWYGGPSLLELLETLDAPAWNAGGPLRLSVQYVIRPDLNFRGYAGRIDSGSVCIGDRVTIMPSGMQSRVKRIVTFDGDLVEAFAPMAVTLVLEDELDISRGDWISRVPGKERLPQVAPRFEATLVWMHETPLQPGAAVLVQHGAARVTARIQEIIHRIDPETYETQPATQLGLNEIGLVRLETARALVLDRYRDNRQTGSFVCIDSIDNFTLAAGMVERALVPEPTRLRDEVVAEFHSAPVTPVERMQRYGHRAALVACRSQALRKALERALFDKGAAVIELHTAPGRGHLRQLLANGLIVLSPLPPIAELDGIEWIEAPDTVAISEAVRKTLRDLQRRELLDNRLF
jgi:sulfate adenylyltransferase large subunit